MAKLTTSQRDDMPASEFAGPGRGFPLSDPTHDRMAISGATRSERAGNISPTQAAQVKAEARSKLGDRPQMHSLSMASADHLHKAGYISSAHHAAIRADAQKRLSVHKAAKQTAPQPQAFGSMAPPNPMGNDGQGGY